MSAEAGWYEVPSPGSGTWSYWDGQAWTGTADVRAEVAAQDGASHGIDDGLDEPTVAASPAPPLASPAPASPPPAPVLPSVTAASAESPPLPPLTPAPPQASSFDPRLGVGPDWSPSTTGPSITGSGAPGPVVLVSIALFGLAALVGIPGVIAFVDSLSLLGGDEFTRALAALMLLSTAIIIVAAGVFAALGVALLKADRAARILTIILAGLVAIGMFTTPEYARGTGEMLAGIGALGVIALLLAPEQVRGWFTGPHALHRDEPDPVVVARAIGLYVAVNIGLLGLLFLLASTLGDDYTLGGLVALAAAVAVFASNSGIRDGSTAARGWVSVALLVSAGVLVWLEVTGGMAIVPLGLAGVGLALLWLPESAQRHFA